MADARGFFKITNGFPEHWKVEDAGGDAGWLYVCALAYCSRNLTDGLIPITIVPRLSDREHPKQLASKLLDVGLWHASGHECKKCVQPDARHYIVHDYLDHQTSAERARETSIKRAIAGQRGGKAKAASSKLLDRGYDGASSKSLAEEEQEEEVHTKKTSSSSGRAKRATRIPDDFAVTADMVAWARKNAPHADGKIETQKFVNYWRAKAGRDATKHDWGATWQNWMLKAEQDALKTGRIALPVAAPTAEPVEWCGACNKLTRQIENDRDLLVPCPTCSPHRRNP